MENKELAVQIVSNVKEGGEKAKALRKAILDYVEWAAQKNKTVFTEMKDESMFFGVTSELVDIALPNKMLIDVAYKAVPFWVKPFVGFVIPQFKLPLLAAILNLLDKELLDKKLGPDWYDKLRVLALK